MDAAIAGTRTPSFSPEPSSGQGLSRTGAGPEQVCLRPACNVCVLDFLREDFAVLVQMGVRGCLLKLDNEPKEEIREEATPERP